jgi:hypothetical protein
MFFFFSSSFSFGPAHFLLLFLFLLPRDPAGPLSLSFSPSLPFLSQGPTQQAFSFFLPLHGPAASPPLSQPNLALLSPSLPHRQVGPACWVLPRPRARLGQDPESGRGAPPLPARRLGPARRGPLGRPYKAVAPRP